MPQVSIMSWNIQGECNITGYTAPRRTLPRLLDVSADIILLQELPNGSEKLDFMCNAGWNVVARKPHTQYVGKNNSALISRLPIISSVEFDLGNATSELCQRTDIRISTNTTLRVYNCHFQIFRSGPLARMQQLQRICEDSKTHSGPVVIAGDLNTTVREPGLARAIIRAWHCIPAKQLRAHALPDEVLVTDERLPFHALAQAYGFTDAFDLGMSTWSPLKRSWAELFQLKLDWFLVKGCTVLQAQAHPYISDHRALEVALKLD